MPLLDWLNKPESLQTASRVPYRLLEAVPELGGGAVPNHNLLIQGDNLEALKALLPLYAGRVKCVYIDPPYNTRSAFEHYDDNLEHSQWLSMMYPRLELLRDLLAEDGSLWVSIDDHEGHYLKVMLDEIFGRKNFIANIVWQKKYAPANDAIWLSDNHDHIFLYAKDKSTWRPNKLPRSEKSNLAYKNPDDDVRGSWKAGDYTCAKSAEERPNLYYPIIHEDPFGTAKPERLLEQLITIATNPGDLVLDSFLGSGTTAAVAHKMGRSYIGVEMGGHAVTHCQPRLQKVVDGEQGGISKAVDWQGGGGFTFCRLGSTVFDEFGMIDKAIRFPTLAAYIWYLETRTPWIAPQTLSPLLGIHDGTAYYLLYNGILGDRRPQGGNVLTQNVLDGLPKHDGKRVIYGETSRFGGGRLAAEGIVFKQIPYDVRVG